MADRLAENRKTEFVEDSDVPSRYGLRKVYKREFDRDPERYVLRIDYPDFPECPFGQSFSMLGFDTAEQTYVWLVTGILQDSRLNRIPYQGRGCSRQRMNYVRDHGGASAAATDSRTEWNKNPEGVNDWTRTIIKETMLSLEAAAFQSAREKYSRLCC